MNLRRRRVYEAAREGLRMRLITEWPLTNERADSLLLDWDNEATRRSINPKADHYWQEAEVWLSKHRTGR